MVRVKIGLVFIGVEDISMGWPYRGFDIHSEAERVKNGLLYYSRAHGVDVDFEPFLVSTMEEFENVKSKLSKMDGIVAVYLTTNVGHILRKIVEMGVPTLIFAQPLSGHEWSLYSMFKAEGVKTAIVATDDLSILADKVKLLEVLGRLKGLKLLVFRDKPYADEVVELFRSRVGVDIVQRSHEEVLKYYEKVDVGEAEKVADLVISKASEIVEPSRNDIVKAARMYIALRDALRDYKANALAIDCLDFIVRDLIPITPCLALSMLNDQGVPAACEADLDSLLTMVILRMLYDKPSFISDPVPDFKNNVIIHAHCTSATKMRGFVEIGEKYALRNHSETLSGVSIQVYMSKNVTVTVGKIVLWGNMVLAHKGTIVDNIRSERGCRTKFAVKVKDVRKFVENFKGGLHRVVVYGDYLEDLEDLAKLMGLRYVLEI